MKSEVKENRNKHLCEKNIILLHMRTANSQSSWRIYTLIRTFLVLRYTMYSSVSCKRATKVPIRLYEHTNSAFVCNKTISFSVQRHNYVLFFKNVLYTVKIEL